MVDDLVITTENPHSSAAQLLIAHLSADLGSRYGDDGDGAFTPDDVLVRGAAFVVARSRNRPVGCGALRPLEPGVGEIKRMFVEPDCRGHGVGARILAALEARARDLRYTCLRLETGVRQPEAIRLYESAGYRRIECYGMYAGAPLSVCFEKPLTGAALHIKSAIWVRLPTGEVR